MSDQCLTDTVWHLPTWHADTMWHVEIAALSDDSEMQVTVQPTTLVSDFNQAILLIESMDEHPWIKSKYLRHYIDQTSETKLCIYFSFIT